MKSGWQLTVPQGGRAGSIQQLGMGVEVLQALRDRRVVVQGEQGDVVGNGISPAPEDHQQLLPRYHGGETSENCKELQEKGHDVFVFLNSQLCTGSAFYLIRAIQTSDYGVHT